MAEGWKQVWEDIRNALRGGAPPVETPPEESLPDGPPAVEGAGSPAVEPAPVEMAKPPAASPDKAVVTAEPWATEPNPPAAETLIPPETPPMPTESAAPPAAASTPPAALEAGALPAELPEAGEAGASLVSRADASADLPQEALSVPLAVEDGPTPEIASAEAAPAVAPLETGALADSDALALAEPSAIPAEDAPDLPAEGPAPEAASLPPAPLWRRHGWTALIVVLAGTTLVNGFFLLGGLHLWTQWTAPKPPAPDVVATFDGGKITTADLEAHFEALVPEELRKELRSLETLRLVVQEMVTDEIARRWAAERKVDADETFRHTMEHITENVNLDTFSAKLHEGGIPVPESEIQAYYEKNKAEFGDQSLNEVREPIRRRLAGEREGQYLKDYIERLKSNASITRDVALLDVPEPTEAELRSYYEANTQSYTMTAQFTVDMLAIPVGVDENAARAAADQALLKLRSGERFGAIPAQVPEVQVITGTVVPAGRLGAEWDAAVKVLQTDEVSDIIRAGDIFYIVRLIQAQPERRLAFEEVRPEVLEVVRRQRTEQWMKDNAAKTLFTLKGKQYTLGQFYKEYQELPPSVQARFAGPQGMQDLADQLIERLLVVEDTYDQLLQVQNKELIDETRLNVLKQMLEQEEVDDKIQVSDEELQQYYDQNQALMTPPPTVRIRYIRIGLGQTEDEKKAARARADEAYKKLVPGLLQQGADFAVVAQEYSEDPEMAAKGGELPFPIGETNNPLEPPELHEIHTVVFGLGVNQISLPFEVGDSLYIVEPIERTQPETLSFEEAKPHIKELLTNQKHDNLLRQLQDRLTKEANLVTYDSVLQAYYEQSAGPGDATPTGGP